MSTAVFKSPVSQYDSVVVEMIEVKNEKDCLRRQGGGSPLTPSIPAEKKMKDEREKRGLNRVKYQGGKTTPTTDVKYQSPLSSLSGNSRYNAPC